MSEINNTQNDKKSIIVTDKAATNYESDRPKEINLHAEAQRLSRIISELPGSPCGTLKSHMKRQGMTIEVLATESGVSEATIKRLRSDPDYLPNKTTAFAICIGLKLEPILQRDWLRKLGIALSVNSSDVFYEILLERFYAESITTINIQLEKAGYQPL